MEILVLRLLAVLLLAPPTLLLAYNLFLALASVRARPSATRGAGDEIVAAVGDERPWPRLAVVIPAHDEEEQLGQTLADCQALDYPGGSFEIVVVADNCTDRTAAIARDAGVRCLERHDRGERGKGFALRWAFDQLLAEGHDAYVVLDADCRLDPGALREFGRELRGGARVLQAAYVVANPDASPISYALAVGNTIENDLYYAPKSRLGWVVALRGTGMVFAREVLEALPWGAYSIVEDLDYSMQLYRRGERVHYLPGVAVRSDFPQSLEQLRVQRGRWAGGNAIMGRRQALRALAEGLRRRSWIHLDMGLTVLSQSRPLQLLLVTAGWVVAALGLRLTADPGLRALLHLAHVLVLGYGVYLAWGVARLGMSGERGRLLLRAPLVVVRLAWIALRGVLGTGTGAWERTPRN